MSIETTNLLLVGIGGQGVLTASEVLSEAAFRQGFDVKKSEVHGMSQRGGGVTSHIRFGRRVDSPLIPTGEADFLVAFHKEEGDKYPYMLKPSGVIIDPVLVQADEAALGRALNTYLLGVLSQCLPIETSAWLEALKTCIKAQYLESNLKVFHEGRQSESQRRNAG